MRQRPHLRTLLGVGLIAGATLALQVLLTRIFSAVLFYHFGFLAISLALLGVGAGAILVYVRPSWFDGRPLDATLARWAIVFAITLVVAIALIIRLDYAYDGLTVSFVANLAAACVLAAIPFLAGGIAIALAIRGYTRSIGRVYAFDLAGAGIGAAAVVPLMWLVSAPVLVVALGVVGALAALLFAGGQVLERRAAGIALAGTVGLVALAATTALFHLDTVGPEPTADRWTPLSRVLAYTPDDLVSGGRGVVIYDKVIGEVVPYTSGDPLPDWKVVQEGPESIGYRLTSPGDALVIGGGGGRDVYTGLSENHKVDLIELNRGIRKVVEEDIGDYSGGPYTLPGVSTTIGDGRSTLARRDKRYDQIQIGFTDTFSANSGQAFALTESNLYTVEAFDEYLDHLKPGGILNVSRPDKHFGDEALRATVLAMEALERRGVQDPERNVVVVLGTYAAPFKRFTYGTVLAKNEPFTKAQIDEIRRLADERGEGVAFAPGGPYLREWKGLAAASSIQSFCSNYSVNVCPPTDDKPFFFHMKRLSNLGGASTSLTVGVPDPMIILLLTLAILSVLAAVAFVLPLAVVRRAQRPSVSSLLFFAAIGLGFLLLEVVLIQRFVLFLGFPTYALSVVLFSLLVFTGAGSLLSTRAERSPRRALTIALGIGAGLIALGAFGLQPLLRALIDLPFAGRLAITVAILAPLGLTLGMAMPLGMRRLAGLYPSGVPWAWGINGIASVLASVIAIAVAINYGFAVATLLALVCYLAAIAHVVLGRWPAPVDGEPPDAVDSAGPPSLPAGGDPPGGPAQREPVAAGS